MTNFGLSPIRMTATVADRILADADVITAAQLTEQHLDVLQLQDLDIAVRAMLGDASDDVAAGRRNTEAVGYMVGEWNARAGR